MARFRTPLIVEFTGKGTRRLKKSLLYESDIMGGPVCVPRGFETDFASVPRTPILFSLFGDTAHEAAVVHDYLYRTGKAPRKIADQVFLEAMKVSGVWAWRRVPMYWGVRLFGGSSYQEKQESGS